MGIISNETGKKIFHLRFINISYRNRGNLPRTHNIIIVIMIKIIIENNWSPLKNMIVDNILNKIILRYSAKKIRANHPPIYSTLNPDTNSDSPSAKSKGLRFVSARHLIIQIINKVIFPQK